MANPERGEVGVIVGGKGYTLRPTFDALCELEELVGKPLHELLQGIQQGRLSGLRAVVWCFLQDQHSDEIKVLKDASHWIEAAGGADPVMDLVHRVLGVNAPDQAPAGGQTDANPPSAQAGTGEPSSPVLVATA